jgi:hypothetical protein
LLQLLRSHRENLHPTILVNQQALRFPVRLLIQSDQLIQANHSDHSDQQFPSHL